MEQNKEQLSGIERDLVLQYLIDGNTPVTITPIEETEDKQKIQSVSSRVFPIALKRETLRVQKNGKIFLENPPQTVIGFENKNVKVEFYFNRIGLYFNTILLKEKDSLVLKIPEVLNRIKDEEENAEYDFSALLYFQVKDKKDLNTKCIPWNRVELLNRPVWKSIPLENQKEAKEYLETFVQDAKIEKNAGNGIQLIPICHFLTIKDEKFEAVQDRVKPLQILYVDHERIVFGIENNSENYKQGNEYGLKMSFSIKESPILSRDVFVTLIINKVYETKKSSSRICIDCVYTSIQEEDIRYLYEKTTKTHLI